jgi:hypothetical protein
MTYTEDIIRELRYMVEALQKENSRLNTKIIQMKEDHDNHTSEMEKNHENDLIKQRLNFQKEQILENL